MQRLSLVVAFVSLAVAGVALSNHLPGTTAQETTSHGIVGAWHVTTFVESAPQTPNMTTFYADGNLLTSNRPVFPAPAGSTAPEARSAGHGVWIAVDDRAVDITFVVLTAGVDGIPAGARTLAGQLTLAEDSATWSGPFTATVTDVDGTVIATTLGRVEATRITIVPMATSATPLASMRSR